VSETVAGRHSSLAVEHSGPRESASKILLLHGLTATRRYVLMGSKALQRGGHHVIGFDARGHGESGAPIPTTAFSYEDLEADALAVIDEARISRAVIVGVSMGAHTAARIAINHPDRVAGLVLITPAFQPQRTADDHALTRWDALADGLAAGGVEGFLDVYGDGGVADNWAPVVRRAVAQRMALHLHPDSVAEALRIVPRSRPFESFSELKGLDIPVAVIGSQDQADPGHPLAVARQWASVFGQTELAVEEPGQPPFAWSGRKISQIADSIASDASFTD